jgi:hypothetical protein
MGIDRAGQVSTDPIAPDEAVSPDQAPSAAAASLASRCG